MGWGDTNLQIGGVEKPSSHLLETKLKLISNTECRSLDKDFIPYVAIDKFCGLYRNSAYSCCNFVFFLVFRSCDPKFSL